jgi:hypothetical protein
LIVKRFLLTVVFCAIGLLPVFSAALGDKKDPNKEAGAAAANHSAQDDSSQRLDGERRFHANCGRCHATPPKFPPRMMPTILRHMRVRATITDEDMRLVLRYMTQ